MKYLIEGETLTNIADTIREISGNDELTISGANLATSLFTAIEEKENDPFNATYNDNITRFFFNITNTNALHVCMRFHFSSTNTISNKGSITIDWGDGTDPEIYDNGQDSATSHTIFEHQYQTIGKYIILISKNNNYTILQNYYMSNNNLVFFSNYNDGNPASDKSNIYLLMSLVRVYEGWAISQSATYNAIAQIYSNCPNLKTVELADWNGETPQQYIPSISNGLARWFSKTARTLEKITLPHNVLEICNFAFYDCPNLKLITIPDTVTTIGANSFQLCYNLKLNSLPNSITIIKSNAFEYCWSLGETFTFYGDITSLDGFGNNLIKKYKFPNNTTVPVLSGSTSLSTIALEKIVVPDALYNDWITATNWANYASYIIKESEDAE